MSHKTMKPKLLEDGTLKLHVQAIDCLEPTANQSGAVRVGIVFTQGERELSVSPPMGIELGKCLCCDIGGLLREATTRVIKSHLNPNQRRN